MTTFAFYGTLMSDCGRHIGLDHLGTYEGPCRIPGNLRDVSGCFPALLEGEGEVKGELWTPFPGCERAALATLDQIEGFYPDNPAHSMYLRKQVRLLSPDIVVSTYVWNGRTGDLPVIESGDWRAYSAELAAAQRARRDLVDAWAS